MSTGFSIGLMSFLKFMLVLSAFAWLEIEQGHRLDISDWVLGIIALLLFLLDSLFLYRGGRGNAFEGRFNEMPKAKRIFYVYQRLAVQQQ